MLNLKPRDYFLSIQHLFAMFGATVLVPLITGLNPSVALFSAGVGTLIFHLCTKGKVPVFLGSSFAFLTATSLFSADGKIDVDRLPFVQGGIVVAGMLYALFALIAYFIGTDRIKKLFPPIVTGPVIIVIGITLSSTAIKDSMGNLDISGGVTTDIAKNFSIALITVALLVSFTIFSKGFFKLVPILLAIISGYIICVILNALGFFEMDFSAVKQASWFNIPFKSKDINGVPFMSLPKFDLSVIISIAPIALVTVMEHLGDITTNSAVVKKDFFKDPGIHRTLLGDGMATMFAGLIGGPANTTYSENTGVLATTKNYNPLVLRVTAVFAIILGLFGKFGAVLQTIPDPVKGGVEIILFGMIAAIGIRTLAEANLDFTHSKNLIIVALILVCGLGINGIGGINIMFDGRTLNISGLFIAVIVGIIANIVLPNVENNIEEVSLNDEI